MAWRDSRLDRRQMIKYTGALGTGAFLAGCTGNGDNGFDDGPPGDDGPDGEVPDFTYVTAVPINSMDPMIGNSELEAILLHNIYDPLLYYSHEAPPTLKPWLAKDFPEETEAGDGMAYTFELREDATFHDGSPVTAEDVVYSVERMLTMQQGFAWMWPGVLSPDSASEIDEHTVEITTDDAFGPFLSTVPYLFVVNKDLVEENAEDGQYGEHGDYGSGWLEQNSASSGPYEIREHRPREEVILDRNEDWWNEEAFAEGDNFDTVRVRLVPERATMMGMMENEEAHHTSQWLALEQYNRIDEMDHARTFTSLTFMPQYAFMNNMKEPLDDVNVRRAISHALDYDQLLNDVAPESEPLAGPLPSRQLGEFDHPGEDRVPQYEQDLDLAKDYLDDSSYSVDDMPTLTFTTDTGLVVKENIGLLLQSNLRQLDIDIEINRAPWSSIVEQSTNPETTDHFQITFVAPLYADPDSLLFSSWHSSVQGSWASASWYENDRVDELLMGGRRSTDLAERQEMYAEAQEIINDEAAAIFINNHPHRWGLHNNVKNYHDNGLMGYAQTFHEYYWES